MVEHPRLTLVGRDRRRAPLLVVEMFFRLCKPGFPLDIEMITFS